MRYVTDSRSNAPPGGRERKERPKRYSDSAPAAAAYVPPFTPPPSREERRDTVAVEIPEDIDPQKTPTEPSLVRRSDASTLLADISSLPPVRYRRAHPLALWGAVIFFGAAVGFLIYVMLAEPSRVQSGAGGAVKSQPR